jgi:hypothetical protein
MREVVVTARQYKIVTMREVVVTALQYKIVTMREVVVTARQYKIGMMREVVVTQRARDHCTRSLQVVLILPVDGSTNSSLPAISWCYFH